VKNIFLFTLLLTLISVFNCNAQTNKNANANEKYTSHNKGKFFILWGGNRENYTQSDVRFWGKDYDFTIDNMVAHDKGKGFSLDYINPARLTIPQNNLKIGYFINDHYSIAIGTDHMKYVMYQDRAVNVVGHYPNAGSYGETLPDNQILLTSDFLQYEHTDGLNFVNTELSRHDDISTFFRIKNTDKIQINLIEGIGTGILFPKTNTTLLGKARHDDYHISGYGVSLKSALNITFLKYFYVQGELKGGYINMSDIRTTSSKEDRAAQDFFFLQRILYLGGLFIL
jgi:hypothetical protein